MKKVELVFIPSPGIGHLVSTVEFAKLLINHDKRLSITFLVMKRPFDTKIAAYTHSLASSSFAERVRFIEFCHDKGNNETHRFL
ncbi:hypothetical protein L6164_001992 [Bauhinia variegata]|uniref:Uncharacterized protein n=1 Tax=Bauhinia variegata TaxID=167791 RepID=A0ACB9PYP1_BAUVA|nr:hypothetical protein L6164_001992 [Bauhinia variegata]